MNYIVKYPALYNVIGCALLSKEVNFTKKLSYLILDEFVNRLKKGPYIILEETIDNILNIDSEFEIQEQTEALYDGVNAKTSFLDIRYSISTGESDGQIEYELQRESFKGQYSRESFYQMKLGSKSLKRGDNYEKPHFSISIWILGNANDYKNYFRIFSMRDDENNTIPYSYIIELDLTKLQNCDNLELKKYLEFFTKYNLGEFASGGDDILKKAAKQVCSLNDNELVLKQIEDEEKRAHDLATEKYYANREGRAKGLAEGRAEGLAEGRAEGLAEGKLQEKIDLIQSMYINHISIEQIAIITNTTAEEIKKILNI